MDGSARAGAKQPDDEDDEDKDSDKTNSRPCTIHSLIEPFCSRGQRLPGSGGSYKWTCLLCSTYEGPIILTGSSSEVLTHYRSSGSGQVRACNGLVNGDQTGWVGVELSQIAVC